MDSSLPPLLPEQRSVLTVEEVAYRYGFANVRRLRQHCFRWNIGFLRAGRDWRFDARAIAELEASMRNSSPPPSTEMIGALAPILSLPKPRTARRRRRNPYNAPRKSGLSEIRQLLFDIYMSRGDIKKAAKILAESARPTPAPSKLLKNGLTKEDAALRASLKSLYERCIEDKDPHRAARALIQLQDHGFTL